MVIIVGVKLESTTVFPNQASKSIKKKAPNDKRVIIFFSLQNLVETKIKNKNGIAFERIKGSIEFKNVSFYYNEDKPILSNFSLPGSKP